MIDSNDLLLGLVIVLGICAVAGLLKAIYSALDREDPPAVDYTSAESVISRSEQRRLETLNGEELKVDSKGRLEIAPLKRKSSKKKSKKKATKKFKRSK